MGRPATLSRRAFAGLTAAVPLAAAGPGLAASDPALQAKFDALADATRFSGAVCLTDRGRTVLSAAAGLANIPHVVPATPTTRFWMASITKVYTSAVVLKLVDAGRVELDAPASRYIPGYGRGEAARITVRQLLNHTSGLPLEVTVSSYEEALKSGLAPYSLPRTGEQLVAAYGNGPPARPVGSTFEYNNADYFVLGLLVEKITGLSWRAAVERHILTPLGLSDTGFMQQARVTPRMADCYLRTAENGPLVNPLPVYAENWYAGGAMWATVGDLAAFGDALFRGRLLSPASLRAFLTPGLDDYGLGLWIRKLKVDGRVLPVAERYGSIMGANGILFSVLGGSLTVAVLANTNLVNLGDFAADLAKARLKAR